MGYSILNAFYIALLMFCSWCTSCLCIMCSTLVIKAQSLNFIFSHYHMNVSPGEISLRGLVDDFIGSVHTEKIKFSSVHSVAYIWAGLIQIWHIQCVYWEFCMHLLCRRFHSTFWLLCLSRRDQEWSYLLFPCINFIPLSPVVPWLRL